MANYIGYLACTVYEDYPSNVLAASMSKPAIVKRGVELAAEHGPVAIVKIYKHPQSWGHIFTVTAEDDVDEVLSREAPKAKPPPKKSVSNSKYRGRQPAERVYRTPEVYAQADVSLRRKAAGTQQPAQRETSE